MRSQPSLRDGTAFFGAVPFRCARLNVNMDWTLDNPLEDYEFGGNLATRISKPGVYFAEVWAGGDMLMSRRLQLVEYSKDE